MTQLIFAQPSGVYGFQVVRFFWFMVFKWAGFFGLPNIINLSYKSMLSNIYLTDKKCRPMSNWSVIKMNI